MAIRLRSFLKNLFTTGAKPTQDNFSDLIDSFRHLNDTGDLTLQNSGIFFPLQTDDDNTRWRLGTPDIVENESSQVTNAVSLRQGRFDTDVMNFVRNGSYYFGRLMPFTAVAVNRLMVGGKLQMVVGRTTDLDDDIPRMQVYAGDKFISNSYNGTNPEGWVCIKPGVTGTFPQQGVTASKNGPTLWFSDISNIRIGDVVSWNGGRYTIINKDGANPAFYVHPAPANGPQAAVSYASPVYAAYGTGRGNTADLPADLTLDDAGWQFYNLETLEMYTWGGYGWGTGL